MHIDSGRRRRDFGSLHRSGTDWSCSCPGWAAFAIVRANFPLSRFAAKRFRPAYLTHWPTGSSGLFVPLQIAPTSLASTPIGSLCLLHRPVSENFQEKFQFLWNFSKNFRWKFRWYFAKKIRELLHTINNKIVGNDRGEKFSEKVYSEGSFLHFWENRVWISQGIRHCHRVGIFGKLLKIRKICYGKVDCCF